MLRTLTHDEIATVHGGIVYFDCQHGQRVKVTVTIDPETLEMTRTYEFTGESCSSPGPYIG